jgi:Nickel responsive protein SCO4226-like
VAETDHRLFLVEHDLRGLSSWQVASVQRALIEAVRRESRRGRRIRYVQCIYAPEEHRCFCLFEAADPGLVRSVNDTAQFPLAHVTAVLNSLLDEISPPVPAEDP